MEWKLPVFGLIFVIESVRCANWNYISGDANGPANWGSASANCALNRQSPIDIVTESVVHDSSLGEFTLIGYDTAQPNAVYVINNNGHGVGVRLETKANQVPPVIELSGGGLNGTYKLEQFHFHWGSDNARGSEHTIDGEMYAAELHLVHYKDEYGNISMALDHGDGLAVLGIMIEVGGDQDNAGFSGFTDYLKNITHEGNETAIPTYALDVMLPDNTRDYFRYMGSLTSVPCNEAVVWSVFEDPVTISASQMVEFRSVIDSDLVAMDNNHRPVQPLNGRTVTASYNPNGQPRVQALLTPLIIALLAYVILL